MKILYPIELLLSSVFSFSYNLTGHYGYALILMSVCITLITTPIYLVADYWKNQEKKIQDLMKNDIDCIKAHYSKQKQFYLTQACHRMYNYKAWYPLRTSLGILIEIPFFFAAFNVLSNFKGYYGVSFGPIKNLGAPDGLLFTINLLPIVMTLLNVVSSIIYSRSFRLKDNTQPFVLATVFLLFLYDSPSALLIYWSCNNFFSLIKNIVIESTKKNKNKIQTANFVQEIKSNRSIILYILCSLFYIGFTFIMSFNHHLIKYCFVLLSLIQVFFFFYFFIFKKKKINSKYLFAYLIYCLCSLAYIKRSLLFYFDFALVIFCVMNCLLFYFLFCNEKTYTIQKTKSSVVIPVLFSFIFTVLLPLQTYFANKMEFPIDFSKIIATLFVTCLISSVILILISELIFQKTDLLLKILLFILVIYFFNGVFFRINAGMMSEFTFQHDSVIINPNPSLYFKDFFIILFAIYIVNYFTKKDSKDFKFHIYIYTGIILAFLCGIMINAYKYKDIKIHVSNSYKEIPEDTKEIHTFTKTGKNVYVFMADQMNGNYMNKILAEEPELTEQLDGFTWYKDCLSKSSDTQTSLPSIYAGNDYSLIEFNKNEKTARENLCEAADFMLNQYLKAGWHTTLSIYSDFFSPSKIIIDDNNTHVFYSNAYSDYFAKKNNFDIYSTNKDYLLQILPLFNLMPSSSKKFVYQKGFWLNPKMQVKERQIEACTDVSHVELIPEFINFTDNETNQFKFFVSEITHTSWCYNKNGEIISSYNDLEVSDEDLSYYAAKKAIHLLVDLINKLKDNNAYDNTIIIFVSDHGNQLENNEICNKDIPSLNNIDYIHDLSKANTILLIKGFKENGKLSISNNQMQNSDIYDYFQESVFYNSKVFSNYLNYSDEKPRIRTYSVDLYQKNDLEKLKKIPCRNYKVEGAIDNPDSWSLCE